MPYNQQPGVSTALYEEQVPAFVGRQLELLYQCVFTTLARFAIHDVANGASTYVVRVDGAVRTVFLFRREGDTLSVCNEQIPVGDDEMRRFCDYVFARYPEVAVVSFYAVDADASRLRYPVQQYNCLEDIVLPLPATAAQYLGRLGKQMQASLRRYDKKMRHDFPSFRLQIHTKDQISEQHIRAIVAMSTARMASKQQQSYHTEATTRQLIALLQQYGWVGVATTDAGICAGVICHRIGSHYFMHVLAHDPRFDAYRLGKLCSYRMICAAIDEGGQAFHLGWGRFHYKYQMGATQRDLYRIDIYRSRLQCLLHARRMATMVTQAWMRRYKLWRERVEQRGSVGERRIVKLIVALRSVQKWLAASTWPLHKPHA